MAAPMVRRRWAVSFHAGESDPQAYRTYETAEAAQAGLAAASRSKLRKGRPVLLIRRDYQRPVAERGPWKLLGTEVVQVHAEPGPYGG